MVFKSERQRKAVMSKLSGSGTKADVTPKFFELNFKDRKGLGRATIATTATKNTLLRTLQKKAKESRVTFKIKRISKAKSIKLVRESEFKLSKIRKLGKGRIQTAFLGIKKRKK